MSLGVAYNFFQLGFEICFRLTEKKSKDWYSLTSFWRVHYFLRLVPPGKLHAPPAGTVRFGRISQ